MTRPAIMSGSMKLPVELVNVEALKKALTITYQPMGAEEPSYLETYRVDGDYLAVPRQFGVTYCRREGIEFEDHTSLGVAVKFPKVAKPRDYQAGPLKLISKSFETYYDFIFRARTGWGKTVGGLIAAAARGVSTLIVVDQENLKDQWIASLVKFFGFKEKDIGIIQGKKCDYKGKAVTIAMVQTLSQKQFPQEVYDYFGMLLVDEVHTVGAPTFSVVLMDFPAAYRWGVSATPKRRDGLQKVLDYNLGRVRVYVDDEHEQSNVYVVEHDTVYTAYANRSPKIGRFVTEVAEDSSRNLLLAESIEYLYDTGRDVLVLSDRIEQLRCLQSLCYYLGIPEEDMGLYAGYTPTYQYDKEPTPARRPEGADRKTQYTPISLKLNSKRNKKADLDRVKNNAKIIFASYGMFSKGVDVPRLSAGVDATPRSQAEQIQGRILRREDGLVVPLWITIADTSSYRSMYALAGRIEGYVKNNSEISRWSLNEDVQLCNAKELKTETLETVKHLKSLQIVQNSAGLNTLVTQREQVEAVRRRVIATSPRRRPTRGNSPMAY